MAALNPKRRHHRRRYHRKHNPSRARRAVTQTRGFLGLPPLMPVVYGAGGYVATAGIYGFVWGTGTTAGMIPDTWKKNADGTENKLTKYVVLTGSLIATTWISKAVLGRGPAALAGIGGGIYVISQAVHDFIPGVVPGMNAYVPLQAYTPLAASVPAAPGAFQKAGYLRGMGAPAYGQLNTTRSAPGSADIVQARFRRFQ